MIAWKPMYTSTFLTTKRCKWKQLKLDIVSGLKLPDLFGSKVKLPRENVKTQNPPTHERLFDVLLINLSMDVVPKISSSYSPNLASIKILNSICSDFNN